MMNDKLRPQASLVQFLVSAEGSRILWVWELDTGAAHSIPNDGQFNNGVLGFQPGRLALLSGANQLRYWDLASHTFTGDAIPLSGVSRDFGASTIISRDGVHGAIVSNYRLHIYDLNTGTRDTVPTPLTERVWHAAFSPDGKTIAAITRSTDYTNPTLRLWNLQTRQFENTIALEDAVSAPVFAPDRPIIAVASGGEIQFWDLQQNQIVQRVPADTNLNFPDPFGFRVTARFSF
jgi:WD40 repeat protein